MTLEFMKRDTKSDQISILRIIDRYGQITRRQLVELTGFSQAKISITINELKSSTLVSVIDGLESSGGRKANLLQLAPEKGMLIGVELGGFESKICLIDFSGRVLATDKRRSPPSAEPPQSVVEFLVEFLDTFRRANKVPPSRLRGIGIAVSGIVNHDTDTCVYFRNQKSWEDFPLKKILEDRWGLPCIMDDSSRMMAVAEKKYGSCRDLDNFVVINVGVGVGAGIFINGNLFRSTHGFGGELGHMVIKENGPRCVCGNYGCLESFVSGYALERQLQDALRHDVYTSLSDVEGVTAQTIIEHARSGDKLAYSIINEAAKHLGIGVANVINIFSPQAVILAGGVSRAEELLLPPLQQVVRASALGSGRNSQILVSSLDEYSGALGAARHWITDRLQRADAAEVLEI
jgi:N-acetylglucosamine repressor